VPVVWVVVYRSGSMTRAALRDQLAVEDAALDDALAQLEASGQVQRSGAGDSATYRAASFVVPVDAEHGWEAAVFDHFQAVVRAIGTKVRGGVPRSTHADIVGGATLGFDIDATHPHRDEVLGLLKRVRAELNELGARVEAHNAQHPIAEDRKLEVSFYFGQCVTENDEDAGEP
jgi:hypothetical protein